MVALGCGNSAAPDLGEPLAIESASEPWQTGGTAGEVLTTEHYRIYTTAKRRMIVSNLPGFMEAAYTQYLDMTGLDPIPGDRRLTIYMMATRSEWALLTENVMPARRTGVLSIEAGGYYYKGSCVFWDIGGAGTFQVAAHEGLHQFLDHRLRDRLPMWLEEGLCVSAEGHQIHDGYVTFTPNRNPFRFSALRTALVERHWLPIAQLLPMDAGDVIQKGTRRAVSYYGQLWAMSMFIRGHAAYRHGLKRILADAEAGRFAQTLAVPSDSFDRLKRLARTYNRQISEPIFRHYITEDLAGFDRELKNFASRHVDLR